MLAAVQLVPYLNVHVLSLPAEYCRVTMPLLGRLHAVLDTHVLQLSKSYACTACIEVFRLPKRSHSATSAAELFPAKCLVHKGYAVACDQCIIQ